MKIKFIAGSPEKVKKKIEKHFDKVRDSVKKSLEKIYGKKFIRQRMFEDGIVFDYNAAGNAKNQVAASGPIARALAEEYVKGWDSWYEEVKKTHQSKVDPESYGRHLVRKAQRRNGDPPHTGGNYYGGAQSVISYSIWSGLFYDSISTAFSAGGNEYMEIGNYLIQSSWKINKNAYPNSYFKTKGIHDYMVQNAGVDDTDVAPFPKQKRPTIANLMRTAMRAGFADPIKKLLGKMEIKL